MLPAAPRHRFRLAEVFGNCLDAVQGRPGSLGLPPLRSAVVVLVDGLGTVPLRARSGHARTLATASGAGETIAAPFPTTTASGLATLTTGEPPGRHGMVGYTVLDPANDRVVNQLSGWDDGMDPVRWQPRPTVFERAAEAGVRPLVVGPGRYRASGFTGAVLRGADYVDGGSIEDRVDRLLDELRAGTPTVGYLYIPELDSTAHQHGLDSDAWISRLEALDGAVARLAAGLGRRDGVLLTADHGALDVPHRAQVVVDPVLLADIRHVAGEPRCLQLHVEPGVDPAGVAAAWASRYGDLAWVATREAAVEAGLFGDVEAAVLPRIGDVLVAARKRVAFYADEHDSGRGMVGQHGSLTPDETGVPLLRFGAAA